MSYSKMMLTSDHQPERKKDGGVYELMKADGLTRTGDHAKRAEMQQRGGSQLEMDKR